MRLLFPLLLIVSCATPDAVRFSETPPITRDEEDFRPFSPRPREYKAATIWDGVDESLLKPLPKLLEFKGGRRALNVNSFDEVPDSTWWTNRKKPLTVEDASRGACGDAIDPQGPFEILSAKPDGWNPGFLVKAPTGKKYFFKFDQHEMQPERMSSAEVIGSLIYHSVGYFVPCYEVLFFERKSLHLTPKSMMKDRKGNKIPMTEAVLDEAFRLAKKTPDGKVRAVSSLLLEGAPIGPWTYSGRKKDDPNDVIPHEDRREVRAGYVLASWISHFDTRDQNTLSTWIETGEGGSGYVRHNILDFGDSIGNLADDDDISRRLGYAYYFDFPYFVQDLFTFGFLERPWDRVKFGAAGPVLGYFDVENFDPENWRSGYPNPGFVEMREEDAAWMARKISEFRDEHIVAIVERAKISNAILKNEIVATLIGRRDKLLRRWFSRLAPFSDPEIKGGSLFLKDNSRKTSGLTIAVPTPSSDYQVVEVANAETEILRVHLRKIQGGWQVRGLVR